MFNKKTENFYEYKKEYYIKNKDKIIKYCKKYRLKNKDKRSEYQKEWRKKNREHIREYDKKRRHFLGINKKFNNSIEISNKKEYKKFCRQKRKSLMKGGGDLSVNTIQLVYEDNIKKYGTLTCYLCLMPIQFGKDNLEHKTPLIRGGKNNYDNLEIACKSCNSKKGSKTVEEYYIYLKKKYLLNRKEIFNMQEVVNKINELVSLLEEKNKTTDLLNRQLSVSKKELESLNEKAVAKLNNAAAMERIYKKYVDFDNEKIEFAKQKHDYSVEMKQSEAKEKELLDLSEKIKRESEELNAKRKTLSAQIIALKEREADFNKKKEELKSMISGQAIKDLLK